jgi:mono/diheme cytochrome c family protein
MKRVVLGIFGLFVLTGCDPKSDMGQQPKYKAYAPNAMMADGASARPLIAGTVPRDPATVPGNAYVASAAVSTAGTPGTVEESSTNPRPIDAALLSRGQEKFEVYCSACHGRLGNGLGMIAQRGFMHPPSFHIDRLKQQPDGYIYNVITAGYGAMYSYSDKIAPPDRWAVVAYVRALQAASDRSGLADETKTVLQGAGDAKAKTAGYRQ